MVSEPDFIGIQTSQPPLDLMTWMPDLDGFGEEGLFGTDFTPTIDQTFEVQGVLDDFFVDNDNQSENTHDDSSKSTQIQKRQDAARRRHAIFQRSPW